MRRGPKGSLADEDGARSLHLHPSTDQLGAADKTRPTASNDTVLFDEETTVAGLILNFKDIKGFDITMAKETYERKLEAAKGKNAASRILNLGQDYWCTGNCNGFGPDEQFFEATYEALSPALLNGYNKPFYRPDAFLAVITVNNDSEDDNSTVHPLNFAP